VIDPPGELAHETEGPTTAGSSRSASAKTNDHAVSPAARSSISRLVAGLLITIDISSLLFVLAIYRFSTLARPVLLVRTASGLLTIGAAMVMAAAILALGRHLRRLTSAPRRQAVLMILMNCGALVLIVTAGELMLRLVQKISVHKPAWNLHLAALRDWEETSAEFRSALGKSDHLHSYHEYHPVIGWTIGKNRRTSDGLYSSSAEGLRSAQQGDVLLTWSRSDVVGLSHPKPYRVALIGDSFTFGYEVPYKDTWSHLIGLELGKDFHVLNFGVMGYSVNQMRLKYELEVRPTRPDILVVGVISHDFIRDGYVYNFMPAPNMLSLPYARPRAVVRDGRLTLLNTPLITPNDIFATDDVHKLPNLQHDMAYDRFEWETSAWRMPQRSFVLRFLTAWPRPALAQQEASDPGIGALGQQVLAELLDAIHRDGAKAVVVFFPDTFEMDSTNKYRPPYAMLAPKIFREARVDYVDATPCIEKVPADRRFSRSGHYGPESNAALATCLPNMILRKVFGSPTRL